MDERHRILTRPDPYTEVLRALWNVLEASAEFVTVVPPGNRIKFMGANRDPIKDTISDADVPEVRIIEVSSQPHPHRTSNAHTDLVTYEIQCSSGDQRLDAVHNALKWIVYKAMADIEQRLLKLVNWKGQQICRLARPVTTRAGQTSGDLERGIIGWSALWAVEVELWFATTDL